ncbi:uncharacterized protein MISP3 [Bombina bombina]|uniref:uncharacterized protein MISP3 n=1 Tax=Bombina bombina TaxID=8345 RepID=UPI00235B1B8D|nr:uncharacterized protein MISP3 [Bombina bombina]
MASELSHLDTCTAVSEGQSLSSAQGLNTMTDTLKQTEGAPTGTETSNYEPLTSLSPGNKEEAGVPLITVTAEEGAGRERQKASDEKGCTEGEEAGGEAFKERQGTEEKGVYSDQQTEGEKETAIESKQAEEILKYHTEEHKEGKQSDIQGQGEDVCIEKQGTAGEVGHTEGQRAAEEHGHIGGQGTVGEVGHTEGQRAAEEHGYIGGQGIVGEIGEEFRNVERQGAEDKVSRDNQETEEAVQMATDGEQEEIAQCGGDERAQEIVEDVIDLVEPDTVMKVSPREEQTKGESETDSAERREAACHVSSETEEQVIEREHGQVTTETADKDAKVTDVLVPDTQAQLSGRGADVQESADLIDLKEHVTDTQIIVERTDVKGTGEGAEEEVSGQGILVDVQVTDREERPGVQRTDLEKAPGAAVTAEGTNANVQVLREAVSADEESTGEIIGTSVEVCAEGTGALVTGADSSSEETEKPALGELEHRNAQAAGAAGTKGVIDSEGKGEAAAKVGLVREASASGEETERKVTPDPATVSVREGTAEPDCPAACWEKECQHFMCNDREARADTAEQTQQVTVTGQDLSNSTSEMRDRDSMVEGETPVSETPIEKEIRLIMEREQVLRQERGISIPVGQQEFVELRRKTITGEQAAPASKERQLAGAQMQREIQQETRREQDLVQLGQVMGTYDRGQQQELQEKKMMFESFATVTSDSPSKKRQSAPLQAETVVDGVHTTSNSMNSAVPNHVAPLVPSSGGKKGPSYAEANGSNVILIEHSSLIRRSAPDDSSVPAPETNPQYTYANPPPAADDSPSNSPGSPFLRLRSPSPRSLLEREIEEVNEREKELRKQRSSLYGKENGLQEVTQKEPEKKWDVLSGTYQPERPSWRRLEVNWPPNREVTANDQQQEQGKDSPRTRRQRSALIQSWESGTPSPRDEE